MNDVLTNMLSHYSCQTSKDYENAMKEIIQEVALLGLWRAKFFEKAAFYGGSALRILYGLNRFSEDLDFSLLKPNKHFSIEKYNTAIISELNSLNIEAVVEKKSKVVDSDIESAFIKVGTQQQLLLIGAPATLAQEIHFKQTLKIKMEIDTNPPAGFETEAKYLLQPIPFSVNTYKQPDLFAGKLHAILCRGWKNRVKGRDWYDFVWYISQGIPVHLYHLQQRLIQSKHLTSNETLTRDRLISLLKDRIPTIDFNAAKKDVLPFITDKDSLDVWSSSFFQSLLSKLKTLD